MKKNTPSKTPTRIQIQTAEGPILLSAEASSRVVDYCFENWCDLYEAVDALILKGAEEEGL